MPRNQWVPFVRKQTSSGSRNPQHRSKLTRRRHGPLPAGYQGAHPRVHFEPWISPLRCSLPVSGVDHDAARLHHAAGWPLSSLAQQPHKVPRIAFLTTASPPGSQYTHAFIRGLADLGRVEGHNIAIEWRWGRGSTEQFPRYAAEVAGLNVDVIVTRNSPAGLAAKNATKTIPIVIATMEDPVRQGFATSLAHPGGSITGLNLQTPACRSQACLSFQNCL